MIDTVWEYWATDTWEMNTWGDAAPPGFDPAWAVNSNQSVGAFEQVVGSS